jgi:hypothetical protein
MTDLEKFIDTYKQFGIEVKTDVNYIGYTEVILNDFGEYGTTSDKFYGDFGFSSVLAFDENGKFVSQGFLG